MWPRSPILPTTTSCAEQHCVAHSATAWLGPRRSRDGSASAGSLRRRWRGRARSRGATPEIRCPADGTLVAEVDEAGPEDTERAIAAAHDAFHDGPWPATSARERGDLLLRVADLLERDADAVARAESLDTGKRLVESAVRRRRRGRRCSATTAGSPPRTPAGSSTPATPTWSAAIVHEPIGVCGADHAVELPAAPGLLEGRALPGRRQHLRAQAQRADPAHRDPPDAAARGGRAARRASANLVLGAGPRGRGPAGRPTRGSTWSPSPAACETGRRLMAAAAAHREEGRPRARRQEPQHRLRRRRPRRGPRLRAHRRLPALRPGLLGRRAAARRGVASTTSFVDELVERAEPIRLGGPFDDKAETGPLISAAHRDKVEAYVAAGIAEGAVLRCGGGRPTTPHSPTASTTCRPSSTAARARCR